MLLGKIAASNANIVQHIFMPDVIVSARIRTSIILIGAYTSPMYLPCWSICTENVIVDIPISNQRSLENVCRAFLRCFSARLEMFVQSGSGLVRFTRNRGKCTYYRCTLSGFPSALRVSRPSSTSAFSSTDIFSKANLAAALRCWKHRGSL